MARGWKSHDKVNVYDEVTAKIVAALEAGTAPWVMPWDASKAGEYGTGGRMPFNASTGRGYNGINVILLWLFGPPGAPGYLTYKQAEAMGAQVREGSKGFRIVFADTHVKREKDENDKEAVTAYGFLKRHTVFHVSQIDGLPEGMTAPPEEHAKLDDDAFNLWVDNTGADIVPSARLAAYMPALDVIGMPALQVFKSATDYKATLLHELGHWTGHAKRLDRGLSTSSHSHAYAREELVAEMTAAFCCARLGIEGQLQHAAYLGSWIKLLKEDNKAIFRAAAAAQKAADYLFALQAAPLPKHKSLVCVA